MPDSAAVRPDEVPERIEAAALTAFRAAIGYSDRERVRAAVAAALTAARKDTVTYELDAQSYHVLTMALENYAADERSQAEFEGGHESRTRWAEIADRMSRQAEKAWLGEENTDVG